MLIATKITTVGVFSVWSGKNRLFVAGGGGLHP
jgi:hypothetical protein